MNKVLVTSLTYIVNNLFKYGYFSDDLTTALVIPVYNEENEIQIENYLPTSNYIIPKFWEDNSIKDYWL